MRDLFDIGAQSQPGERQTDIELIIEEKKQLEVLLAAVKKKKPSPGKGFAIMKIEEKIAEIA